MKTNVGRFYLKRQRDGIGNAKDNLVAIAVKLASFGPDDCDGEWVRNLLEQSKEALREIEVREANIVHLEYMESLLNDPEPTKFKSEAKRRKALGAK